MPELVAILNAKKDTDYENKKFFAALQGVDIDEDSNRSSNAWEDLKARVFSNGSAKSSNDILSLQGVNARQAGFGIGAGLEYEDGNKLKNPFG